MRKLMWFSIGFACACAAGAYLFSVPVLFACGVACSFAALILLLCSPRICKLVAIILIGCTVGVAWFWGHDYFYIQHARQFDENTMSLEITVTDYSQQLQQLATVDGTVVLNGRKYDVKVWLDNIRVLKPGDVINGSFKLYYTGSGDTSKAYYQGNGIFLVAYAKGNVQVSYSEKIPLKAIGAHLRKRIIEVIIRSFPEDTAGFAKALLLGDVGDLSYEEDLAFQNSGIRHIVAVSGLHVSILFALAYGFVGKRRVLSAMIGIPVLVIFAAIAGFTPSIVRACVMQILMLLAMLLNREYDPPTALSVSGLIILGTNPLAVTSVSFQLSVGCIIGIFLFSGKIYTYLLERKWMRIAKGKTRKAKLVRGIIASISATLGAISLTTPLSVAYFGVFCTVGILTNLLTLWIVSFVFYGILATCAVGALFPQLGSVIAWVVSWPMRYVLTVAKIMAELPYSAVSIENKYVFIWLLFSYILLAAFLFCKYKRPFLLTCSILFGMGITLFAAFLEPHMSQYVATFLDVGQGQCIVLRSEDDCYIVDCGSDSGITAASKVANMLKTQGIKHVDGVILTHFDTDHCNGIPYLLTQLNVDAVYTPYTQQSDSVHELLLEEYPSHIRYVQQIQTLNCGNGDITVIPGEKDAEGNESSLCILFQTENCDILITGDRSISTEHQLLQSVRLRDIEVLVVGHHGSNTSTGMQLLDTITPQIAVISVGLDNPYGHPSQEVIERLEFYGCQILRTDQDGTITIRG